MSIEARPHRWAPVEISKIEVGERQRPVSQQHVAQLRESYERLGGQLQLQPIVLDNNYSLIDGAHRLEAAKQSGWSHIAAVIIHEVSPHMRSMLEIESNRVRMSLTPIELEQAWRIYYEPLYRAAAKQRRLQGLKRGNQRPVIGNSNNGNRDRIEGPGQTPELKLIFAEKVSLSEAAKQVTGLSVETLNKIAEIRAVSSATEVDEDIRNAALEGMQRISARTASTESVYRSIRAKLRNSEQLKQHAQRANYTEQTRVHHLQKKIDRVLHESTLLAENLDGSLAFALESAARLNASNREQLRAIRVALAKSLATVVSAECRLTPEPRSELRTIGAEVSRLLSSTSLHHLKAEHS